MKLTDFNTLTFDCYGTAHRLGNEHLRGGCVLCSNASTRRSRGIRFSKPTHVMSRRNRALHAGIKRYQELLRDRVQAAGRGMAGAFHVRGVPRLRQVRTQLAGI